MSRCSVDAPRQAGPVRRPTPLSSRPCQGDDMTDDTRPVTADVTFAVVPTWVIFADISDRAIRLYSVLRRYADIDGVAWPSRARLARDLSCSVDSIDRAIGKLISIGALTAERRFIDGVPTSNLYRLHAQPVGRPVDNPVGVAAPVRHERKPLNEETPNPAAAGGCAAHRDAPGRSCRACGTSPRAVRAAERAARPKWCGDCDEKTRLRDYDTTLPYRCPSCHPLMRR